MSNVNGTGWRVWIVGIVGVLITAGVVAAVRDSSAQKALAVQVETNSAEIARSRKAVEQIPVMAEKVESIEEDIEDMRDQMTLDHKEVMEAIRAK